MTIASPSQRLLALTPGDPAGIGPDITILAWQKRQTASVPPFLFVGPAAILKQRAADLGVRVEAADVPPGEAAEAFEDCLPCTGQPWPTAVTPGKPDVQYAEAVIGAIASAVDLVSNGAAAAVVTNPISKHLLHVAGFSFPGHTEYLAHLAQQQGGVRCRPVMMMCGPDLRTIPITIHIPLAAVPDVLTTALIEETGAIVHKDLRDRFDIANPRLVATGLNPHAGEQGSIGLEDEQVIRPAVAALSRAGIDCRGPLPADSLFHPEARAGYDAALCMYHDQALIPVKALAFDRTVNVTLGLPFVRTSPDHGTAFDIAGRGGARPDSLVAALDLASRLASKARQS